MGRFVLCKDNLEGNDGSSTCMRELLFSSQQQSEGKEERKIEIQIQKLPAKNNICRATNQNISQCLSLLGGQGCLPSVSSRWHEPVACSSFFIEGRLSLLIKDCISVILLGLMILLRPWGVLLRPPPLLLLCGII